MLVFWVVKYREGGSLGCRIGDHQTRWCGCSFGRYWAMNLWQQPWSLLAVWGGPECC